VARIHNLHPVQRNDSFQTRSRALGGPRHLRGLVAFMGSDRTTRFSARSPSRVNYFTRSGKCVTLSLVRQITC